MLDEQILDLRGHQEPFKIETGSNIVIKLNEGDKELKIILDYIDAEFIENEINKQLGINEVKEELELDRKFNEDHIVLT